MHFLAAIGRKSQFMLLAGLLGGLTFPQAAGFLREHLTELILALLFFAALRLDPRRLDLTRASLGHDLSVILASQLLLPLAIGAAVALSGWSGAFAAVLILIAAGSPITGTPPIAQMLDLSATVAMRLLILGTLLIPLTSILPLRFAFGADSEIDLFEPALRLAAIIVVSVGAAVVVRLGPLRTLSPRADEALGGVTAILLAVFVLALMDAIQPALLSRPLHVAGVLLFACLACFGLQIAAAHLYCKTRTCADSATAGAVGVAAGNRNIALFLAALPAAEIEPLMVLVGCYQIPMYLTPLIMKRVYPRLCGSRGSRGSHGDG
jgi:arsenite transporter